MSANVVAKCSNQPAGGCNVGLDTCQRGHPGQSAATRPRAMPAVMQCFLTNVRHDDLRTLKPPAGAGGAGANAKRRPTTLCVITWFGCGICCRSLPDVCSG